MKGCHRSLSIKRTCGWFDHFKTKVALKTSPVFIRNCAMPFLLSNEAQFFFPVCQNKLLKPLSIDKEADNALYSYPPRNGSEYSKWWLILFSCIRETLLRKKQQPLSIGLRFPKCLNNNDFFIKAIQKQKKHVSNKMGTHRIYVYLFFEYNLLKSTCGQR